MSADVQHQNLDVWSGLTDSLLSDYMLEVFIAVQNSQTCRQFEKRQPCDEFYKWIKQSTHSDGLSWKTFMVLQSVVYLRSDRKFRLYSLFHLSTPEKSLRKVTARLQNKICSKIRGLSGFQMLSDYQTSTVTEAYWHFKFWPPMDFRNTVLVI